MSDVEVEIPTLQSVRGVTNIRIRPLIDELKILTKDREIKRLGDVINWAQEDFITEVERQINSRGAVRIVVLKARQLGISTIIEAIIFALSIIFNDYQSLIISHESDSAEHILGMTKRYWTTYTWKEMHDEQYNGRKQLAWADLQSNIVVATAKNTSAGRSKTLHALHASEVAFWDNPQELIRGLRQAIPSQGVTLIFYESTANGVGNFFHKEWSRATIGNSEFAAKFYPWHQHPEYTAQYIPIDEQARFAILGELSDEEKELLSMGVSEARLIWRRYAISELCGGDIDTFNQEYPSTPNQAFLSTGRNVFDINNLNTHFQKMTPRRGYLERKGNSVVFKDHVDGMLKVFRFPSQDRAWGIYQIGGDPTHTVTGDQACAHVISRRTMEQCAVLAKGMDPVEFGKQLELLGYFYNTATVAPEREGGGGATVGYLLGVGYPMVWESQKFEKTPGKVMADVFGWGTNKATKSTAIGWLTNCINQPLQKIGDMTYGLVLHDEETYEEMKNYISDEKGGYCNGDGSLFDDRVMALAICVATHFIDPPVPPYQPDTSVQEIAKEVIQHTKVEPTSEVRRELEATSDMQEQAIEQAPWENWTDGDS